MDEKTKLQIIGKIEAGCNLREIVREFRVPYPAVKKIADDLQKEENKAEIISTVKTKEIVEGEIVETKKLVEKTNDDIERLSVLHSEIQETASLALSRIRDLLNIPNIEVKELAILIDSLSKLQSAFFKSQNPIVNVINTEQYNEQTLQVFQDLKKP